MKFSDIKGNEDAKRVLRGMADNGRVAHAMLLYENEGCGALPLALAYFQYLNCSSRHDGDSCGVCPSCRKISKLIHPDLHFVFPVNSGSKVSASEKPVSDSYLKYWRELVAANPYFLENELYAALGIEGKSGNIAVAEAKSILDKLSLASVENGYKAVIIWLPEKMNAEAANRLLKIIEEPPQDTVFLLVTHAPEKVLQTIFSRCQSLRIQPAEKAQVAQVLTEAFNVEPSLAQARANVAGGSVGVALEGLGEREDWRRFMDMFADMLRGVFARDLMSVLEAAESMAAIESREKQKAFCTFAGDCVRKIFMMRKNMAVIANVADDELEFFEEAASKCSDSYCMKAMDYLDKASSMLERNVNPKIVFCDFADRMFISI